MLITDFHAFCGNMDLGQSRCFSCRYLPVVLEELQQAGARGSVDEAACVQWLSDGQRVPEASSSARTLLLLAGSVASETLEHLNRLLLDRAYERISLRGDVAGAFLSPQRAIFFKSHTSNQSVFYRREETGVRWSTNPMDLLTSSDALNFEALLACCQASDAWIYRGISWVEAGCLVELTHAGTTIYHLPLEAVPLPPSSPASLQTWARFVYERVLAATAPLAQSGQTVGALLSGGIDSAVLVAALVKNGGRVVAYHLQHQHPAADESAYARAVCATLGVPLRCIPATMTQHFSFDRWHPAHPYGHPGYPWFAQVARQMEQDGIRLLTTGRYGDITFGPLEHYGLSDILTAPITRQEKRRWGIHTLTTDWTLPEIVRSSSKRFSLITPATLTQSEQKKQPVRQAEFLCPAPATTESLLQYSDFPGVRTIDFSPQDLVVEQLWRHSAIHVFHPYGDPGLQSLASALPSPYRLFAYRGQKVTKPVLRLAFAHCLPPEVIRRNRGTWMSAPIQDYCLTHREWLANQLGQQDSCMVQRGLVDPQKLHAVLQNPRTIRANAYTLVATMMTKQFLDGVGSLQGRSHP